MVLLKSALGRSHLIRHPLYETRSEERVPCAKEGVLKGCLRKVSYQMTPTNKGVLLNDSGLSTYFNFMTSLIDRVVRVTGAEPCIC